MNEIIIATCSLEVGKAATSANVDTVLVDRRMVLHGGRATSAVFNHACLVTVESDTPRLP